MDKVICVYSSSSDSIDSAYFNMATELGRAIASNKDILLFGGGMRGLMGATATAVHKATHCTMSLQTLLKLLTIYATTSLLYTKISG